MSTDGSNFISRVAARTVSRIARGLRAARRPWVVVAGLLYFAGDLSCIAGRREGGSSVGGQIVRAVLLIDLGKNPQVYMREVIVVDHLDGSPVDVMHVQVVSWGDILSEIRDEGNVCFRVHSGTEWSSPWTYAPTWRTRTEWVRVERLATGELSGPLVDEATRQTVLDSVRLWNETANAKFGTRPLPIEEWTRTTVYPWGFVHNAMSLLVLVLVANGVPSVTIGAWRRRRAARRMARGQCAKCGYELGAAAIDRCPECGAARVRGEGA